MNTITILSMSCIFSALISVIISVITANYVKKARMSITEWQNICSKIFNAALGKRRQFRMMQFQKEMQVIHNGKTYDIISVDWHSDLVGVKVDDCEYVVWLRCEECEFLTSNKV